MFNVKCTNNECSHAEIEYTFLGLESYVRCGGCANELTPYNEQSDPELPNPLLGVNPE